MTKVTCIHYELDTTASVMCLFAPIISTPKGYEVSTK